MAAGLCKPLEYYVETTEKLKHKMENMRIKIFFSENEYIKEHQAKRILGIFSPLSQPALYIREPFSTPFCRPLSNHTGCLE